MKITLKKVDANTFRMYEQNFACENFFQTADYYEFQIKRGFNLDNELVLFYEGETVIGGAYITYRKKFKFFKEAIVIEGPLFDYTNKDCTAIFEELKKYVLSKGVHHLIVSPYIEDSIFDTELNPIQEKMHQNVHESLINSGYNKINLPPDSAMYIYKIFRKDLSVFENEDQLFKSMKPNIKKRLNKLFSRGFELVETDDSKLIYEILLQSSERKQHELQNLEYFQHLASLNNKKYILVKLHVPTYIQSLHAEITKSEVEIKKIEERNLLKNSKTSTELQKNNVISLTERIKEAETFEVDEDGYIILSGMVFFESGHEVIGYLGANITKYANLHGYTLGNWEMMRKAFTSGKRYYNFFGVIEVEMAKEKKGNFYYKKNWGGELVHLIGYYEYSNSFLYNLVAKLKK